MKCIIYNNGFIFVVTLIKFKPSSLSRTSRFDKEYSLIWIRLSCTPISNNDFLRIHIEAINETPVLHVRKAEEHCTKCSKIIDLFFHLYTACGFDRKSLEKCVF